MQVEQRTSCLGKEVIKTQKGIRIRSWYLFLTKRQNTILCLSRVSHSREGGNPAPPLSI